jgi:hypothetical protein
MHGMSNKKFKNQKCTGVQNVKFNEKSDSMKVKASFTVEQAMKAQRGSRGIALLFLEPQR